MKRTQGFTLIEILVALAILAFGMTAVLSLFIAGVRTYKRAMDQSTAAMLAESVLADLEEDLKGDFVPDPVFAQTRPHFPGYKYDLELKPLDVENHEILVSLTIWWGEGKRRRTEVFQTILLRK